MPNRVWPSFETGATCTVTGFPSRSTVIGTDVPGGHGGDQGRHVGLRRDPRVTDLAQHVAHLELAVGRHAVGDVDDLDGRVDRDVELGQRGRHRGVLGGHHLDLALRGVLLLAARRAVLREEGVDRVVARHPRAHQGEEVEPRVALGDRDGRHPELPVVLVRRVSGHLDDGLAVVLAEHVDGRTGREGDERQTGDRDVQPESDEQRHGQQSGPGALSHAGSLSDRENQEA